MKMKEKKEYVVYVTETLQRKIIVEAETLTEAEEIAQEKYNNEEIVLNELDYLCVEFDAINK